ncbi:MAG: DUF1844 domain-containing protein [Phycisphaerae bacterium]|jgi:hypothetical protein
MGDNPQEQPRIFVDSDWKEQARREKEELDRQTREEPARGQIPDPSVLEIVQMVVVQASLGLGGYQDPQTGQVIPPNLAVARHYIDLLDLVYQKMQANLDEHERRAIQDVLHDLRMAFVQVAGGGPASSPPDGRPGGG